MKKLFTFFAAIIVASSVFAQSPEKMSYQAVVRDTDGLVSNRLVSMQISIMQGTADGLAVYIETHTPTTNVNGLITFKVGTVITSDDFSAIDWSAGPYFVKSEIDPSGGSSYTITGTDQLSSVPYALHTTLAESATTAGTITGTITESQVSDLQSYLLVETDPLFTAWDRSTGISITESQVSNLQSYLTVETDPLFTAWDRSTGISITESQVSDLGSYLAVETDPVYTASQASNITAGDITNLSNLSGINTGDQDLSGLATRANVLELNNTTAFTPDADYEPATKRYVDDAISPGHYIGELFGGGIVFWVTPDGANGLIASLEDLDGGTGAEWGIAGLATGAVNHTDGVSNTANILATGPVVGTAARLVDAYAGGTFTDWYLPSNRELEALAAADLIIDYILENDGDPSTEGIFQNFMGVPVPGVYWSSNEWGAPDAIVYKFYASKMDYRDKSDLARVRAVRAF